MRGRIITRTLVQQAATPRFRDQKEDTKSLYKGARCLIKTDEHLLEYLLQHKLYEDDHFVAFNKPVWIPMKAPIPSPLAPGGVPEVQEPSVFGISSQLSSAVLGNNKPMHAVYSLHREYSGVILFAKTIDGNRAAKKMVLSMKAKREFYENYIAVTVGVPKQLEETCTIHLKKVAVDQEHLSQIVEKTAMQKRQRNLEMRSTMIYKVLCSNGDNSASLVKINTSSVKWEAIQMLMASRLCPILGDHIYSRLITTLTGTPIFNRSVSRLNNVPRQQILPKSICQDLNLAKSDSWCLPLHLHCESIQIPEVLSSETDEATAWKKVKHKKIITVHAQLPDFYRKTLFYLGLKYDEIENKH